MPGKATRLKNSLEKLADNTVQGEDDGTAISAEAGNGYDLHDEPRDVIEHLLELRRRLLAVAAVFLAGFCLCYYFCDHLMGFFIYPLKKALGAQNLDRRLIYTHLTEGFVTHIKVSAFFASLAALPCLLIQVWRFIAPALFKQERRHVAGILISTPLLFLAGVIFAYVIALPGAYKFFITFEQPATSLSLPIRLEAKLNEYMSFVMQLLSAFGICFEMPVLFVLLSKLGIIKADDLLRRWRIAVVAIFTLAAVITPPDIFSMIALALPLIGLYFLSCALVRVFGRR